MPIEIAMPELSEDMPEGVVVEWRVAPGEPVEKGQVVAEVETDKAVVELEAPGGGVLAVQAIGPGQSAAAGALLAVLAETGEDVGEIQKRYAGRVAPSQADSYPAPPPADDLLRVIPLTGMRGAIAARMLRSIHEIAHYQVMMDCDASGLLRARKGLKRNRETRDISLNAMLLKCVAAALKEHPAVNATIVGDVIYQHARCHVGVAVALPSGVVAPVVRDVGGKSLAEVSDELEELTEAARRRKLTPEQLRGGTFTVSTLGSFGVHHFTAIIVPPQVGILAVGAVRAEPVVLDGAVVPGERIALTISADHRAVDGAVAAEFLRTLKNNLEDPEPFLS